MNDLPNYDFDACKFVFCKTNKYGYAKYDTNSYSTSSQFACTTVTLKISAMNVTVLDDNSEVIVIPVSATFRSVWKIPRVRGVTMNF